MQKKFPTILTILMVNHFYTLNLARQVFFCSRLEQYIMYYYFEVN